MRQEQVYVSATGQNRKCPSMQGHNDIYSPLFITAIPAHNFSAREKVFLQKQHVVCWLSLQDVMLGSLAIPLYQDATVAAVLACLDNLNCEDSISSSHTLLTKDLAFLKIPLLVIIIINIVKLQMTFSPSSHLWRGCQCNTVNFQRFK